MPELPEIKKELLCRVGQDWFGNRLFIGELKNIDSEMADLVAKKLKISPKDLHDLTCVIKDFGKPSFTGDSYLASKVLKLKVKITIEECELVDDVPVEPE